MNSKVYIIIVTYNAMKWIEKCLNSIEHSTTKANVVVIDNCSKDETVDYIASHFPNVHIIENQENRGFGQANNQGIEYAYKQGATHFFLLNQDAYIHEDTIEKLINVQDKYDLALVSPIHLNGKGDKMDNNFFTYVFIQEKNNTMVSDLLFDNVKDYYPVEFVNAAGWMINRKTIEEIGGFDPLFFIYGEDSNYCQRLKYHKKALAIVSSAIMLHDREDKGHKEVYNEKKYISWLLSEYANINGHSRYFKKMILYSLCNMAKNLITFKWHNLNLEIGAYLKILIMRKRIVRSKSANVVIQPNWLKLN